MLALLSTLPLSMSTPRRAVLQSASSFALGSLALSSGLPASAIEALPQLGGSPVYATEAIMAPKAHGTSDAPVQKNLKWAVDQDTADRITNYNRRYAEFGGYWKQTNFLKEVSRTEPTTYYDSVTGKPLFRAPIGRSMEEFLAESNVHGWPSFRDQEVVWANARVLRDGETVSATGTHVRTRDSNPRPLPRTPPASLALPLQTAKRVFESHAHSWATICRTRRATGIASIWCPSLVGQCS